MIVDTAGLESGAKLLSQEPFCGIDLPDMSPPKIHQFCQKDFYPETLELM